MSRGPLVGQGRERRLAPFSVAMLLGLVLSPLSPDTGGTVLAAGLCVALVAGMWIAPWDRLPVWTQALPFYLALPVIGLLRHVNGGQLSGYAPLALLPVLWLALHFGRRQLLIGIAVLSATFLLPLLLADGAGDVGVWRLWLLLALTAGVVGFTTCDLTDQLRHRAADLQAIGRAARALPTDDSARAAVCRASWEVSGADFVLLLEPAQGGRRLRSTATHGLDVHVTLPVTSDSVAVHAFRSGEAHFVQDCALEAAISAHPDGLTGASVHVQPVRRGDVVVGVLLLGFRQRLSRLPSRLTDCMEVIAAEASLAIERADLLGRLAAAAHTDGLTGATNRRGWDLAVRRDLAPADDRPVVVAMLDLDHFKRFNDTHGHQAGDQLLQECVRRWTSALRAGDTLARWGGEEFALLLPACDEARATKIIERLRACVPSGCTVSVGATVCRSGEDPAAVVARADAALYAAKHAGRDRAEWHGAAVVDLTAVLV